MKLLKLRNGPLRAFVGVALLGLTAAVAIPDTAALLSDVATQPANSFSTGTLSGPSWLTADYAGAGTIDLSWDTANTSAFADGFVIERAPDYSGPWTDYLTVNDANAAQVTDTNAAVGFNAYRIRATKGGWTSGASGAAGHEILRFTSVEPGDEVCGLDLNEALYCWGDGGSAAPELSYGLAAGSAYTSTSSGTLSTCVVQDDSTAWCHGWNDEGEQGTGSSDGDYHDFASPVEGGAVWASVQVGDEMACGLRTDSTLWCWGTNWEGQLGDGTTTSQFSPTQVSGGGTWKSFSVGIDHVCAIKPDSTLWCWGVNNSSDLGTNDAVSRSVPTQIAFPGAWKSVTTGSSHTCGIQTDGTAWCWGYGDGALGNGSADSSVSPVAVAGGGTWKQLSAGTDYTCGIKSDDSAWCWGRNDHGEIGDGSPGDGHFVTSPVQLAGGGSWQQVSAGYSAACGVRSDNVAFCWGQNDLSQVGDNTTTDRESPTRVWGQ